MTEAYRVIGGALYAGESKAFPVEHPRDMAIIQRGYQCTPRMLPPGLVHPIQAAPRRESSIPSKADGSCLTVNAVTSSNSELPNEHARHGDHGIDGAPIICTVRGTGYETSTAQNANYWDKKLRSRVNFPGLTCRIENHLSDINSSRRQATVLIPKEARKRRPVPDGAVPGRLLAVPARPGIRWIVKMTS